MADVWTKRDLRLIELRLETSELIAQRLLCKFIEYGKSNMFYTPYHALCQVHVGLMRRVWWMTMTVSQLTETLGRDLTATATLRFDWRSWLQERW